MAIFRTYDDKGNIQLSSQDLVWSLVKASHPMYAGTNAQVAGRVSETLSRLVRGNLVHLAYVDVVSDDCPVCFLHYDGELTDEYGVARGWESYKMLNLYEIEKTGANTYRFWFSSVLSMNEQMLKKYRVYIFDRVRRKTKVGLNLYDETGKLKFSSQSPPLQIVKAIQPSKGIEHYKVINGYDFDFWARDVYDGLFGEQGAIANQQTLSEIQKQIAKKMADSTYSINYSSTSNSYLNELVSSHINNYGDDIRWFCMGTTDVYAHPLVHQRKYAGYVAVNKGVAMNRHGSSGSESVESCAFAVFGVNGGIVAGASLLQTPTFFSQNNGVRQFYFNQELYPSHPMILVADVTDFPFPYE